MFASSIPVIFAVTVSRFCTYISPAAMEATQRDGGSIDLSPSSRGRVLGGMAGGGTQEVEQTGAVVKHCRCIQGEGADLLVAGNRAAFPVEVGIALGPEGWTG